jgi:hypothetical protein
MDGIVAYFKAELSFTKKEKRGLVDFFDANGDGDIEPNEFSDVIKQVSSTSRKSSRTRRRALRCDFRADFAVL